MHHVVSLLPQNSLSFINSIICIPVIHIIFILLPNETMFLNYFIDLGQWNIIHMDKKVNATPWFCQEMALLSNEKKFII